MKKSFLKVFNLFFELITQNSHISLAGPVSLQKKLQMMQQQLLDMTDIPPQIQSKLASVTKALEQFIMDPEALDDEMERETSHESEGDDDKMKQFSTIESDDVAEEEEANDENFEIGHSTRETSYSFEDLVYEEEEGEFVMEEEDDNEGFVEEEEEEEESEMTEEKLKMIEERKKKNEKIQTLQKSWQKLCENSKTIHK